MEVHACLCHGQYQQWSTTARASACDLGETRSADTRSPEPMRLKGNTRATAQVRARPCPEAAGIIRVQGLRPVVPQTDVQCRRGRQMRCGGR